MEEVSVAVRGISLNVLVDGPADGTPVLLVHGNCSSADFWRPLLRQLPPNLRIVAPDLRGYGRSDAAPVDATRGLRDFADDVAALLDERALFPAGGAVTVAAHSMGCGVVMHLLAAHPERVRALLFEAPLSPYGFGGTRDLDGTPTTPDFAGSGGGTGNPDFVRRIADRDRGVDSPTSPLNVLRTAYVADPASLGADEQLLLDTVLSTAIGDDNYPGDSRPSANWPGMAPGDRGVLNTMAPNHFNVAADLVAVPVKPPITWVRGDRDAIVSDTSFFDLAFLGSLGMVPGWPGAEACPPQPMVGQTRAVLDRYEAAGGRYTEVVLPGCGHSPHVERPAEVAAELLKLI
ncbi:alpha/beta hydrolase [Paractinoplanes rishiriensis]|uniref:Alpha/beta hydrolase n=1 Tax=Paractinoplanes rishiriensis TaxID=1050105 RepID=A0A919JR52_9ACTN|nr:alpha/beta fold hydrolase [Actinoplanes rishiriensis]GIE93238.1 alpha/beta hydrolase [Actinoplanes rishiriensis]